LSSEYLPFTLATIFITPSLFFLSSNPAPPYLHSFPTRRSSDLQRKTMLAKLAYRAATQLSPRVAFKAAHLYCFKGMKAINAYERSEEHTSELQSQSNLVCRLLLEKKNNKRKIRRHKRKSNDLRR